ncbi:hypothetical protein [Ramlibacter humi]|uniref:Uncharacterized protein n=1 Tax=Ramlibacter humi TaxID=2530451 RepID=A0A4Z0CC22_9BURK|nr:hypothetical protein [Ramlibacter humi]TFZ07930.1 hypothetical protein EZ216_01835 [Ramlibacter humi]
MKFTIAGEYWDSQIYSGELLLIDSQNAVHRIDWRALIDKIASANEKVQTALRVAFADSDLFYNPKVQKILRDPEIEAPIKRQLDELADLELSEPITKWREFLYSTDSALDFLPTDTDVYYNHILFAGDEGLFSVPRYAVSEGKAFQPKVRKHHDGRIFRVRSSDSFTSVACAAGDDGLLEFPFRPKEAEVLDKLRLLARRSCVSCDWVFQSVLGWSSATAFLASFREIKDPRTKRSERMFDRIIDPSEMFEDGQNDEGAAIWGCREKLYRLTESGLQVTDYSPKPDKDKARPQFQQRGASYADRIRPDEVVSTGTAPFGTVIETSTGLIVHRSDGNVEVFDGEPVHWRVFSRSEHYSNQLHIIYEDRLVIVSFVHDYFVDQKGKIFGFARGKRRENLGESAEWVN